MTFQRENRYIVVKLKDLAPGQEADIREHLTELSAQPVDSLVIERDWPEYEPAWRMIQARVEGATLSPAHIEDGEEVEVVGHLALDEPFNGADGLEIGEWEFVPERSAVESMLAVSTGEMVPLMTVAQHQRIVAARASKAADSVDWSCLPGYLIDHYEGWSITEEGLQFAISEMLKDPDYLRVQAEKAALSAPPAAVEDDSFYSDDPDLNALLSSAAGLLKVGPIKTAPSCSCGIWSA